MKKAHIYSVGLMVLLMILLAGCGNSAGKKPDRMSDRAYELGCAALETVDDYIADKISAKDALKKLETAYDSIEYLVKKEKEEVGSDTLAGTDYSHDAMINIYIHSVRFDIQDKDRGTGTLSDVKNSRDKLAKVLGK